MEAFELMMRILMSVQSVLCTLQLTSKFTQKEKILKIGGSMENNTHLCRGKGEVLRPPSGDAEWRGLKIRHGGL